MNPQLWGHSGWTFFFSVALNFPQNPDFNDIHNYKRFFTDVQYILPCHICCEHYVDHLQQVPIEPYLINTHSLFNWLLKIHNLVNQCLKKPIATESDILLIYFGNDLNVNSPLWEFSIWKFLFYIAEGYPENPSIQNMFHYKRFFTYLQFVFPCPIYKKYYSKLFNDVIIDPYLKNNHYIFIWVLKVYNFINLQMNRPILTTSLVRKKYFYKSYPINKRAIKHCSIEGFSVNDQNHSINPYSLNLLPQNIPAVLLIILFTVMISSKIISN